MGMKFHSPTNDPIPDRSLFSKGPSIWKDMIDFYVQVRPVTCKINRVAKHR